ncbi:Hypothetical protein CpCP13_1454 [Corynebacterium pseudotuberculosis]|nr:Hypothetical protein CpPAT10_1416b [Corynebacterium pseudotuberculosis PAT10]AEP70658.1 Hypothetical protein Cp4202_1409 [Corynebacterium pseudotuberculosis 42/02-A]AFF22574.1 Hypothetical protein CpP54B96_1443 [Corynebacterium pseudotuberculosis P54B96]AFH52375.1 Hypothetical protein Cp267_1479 [Corynebacterium pseudotuberculosis 267]AJC14157.1 Hypothetical protein CpVD57_1448 [Corynebacterium pseudotuberculosis]
MSLKLILRGHACVPWLGFSHLHPTVIPSEFVPYI